MLVSLCWQPVTSRLTVVVLKARNLPKMDVTGLADPYVKIYLLYNQQRIAKKKTHVKKRTLSPVFNESFVFDIPNGADGLNNVSLEFMLLDWDRVTKNEVNFTLLSFKMRYFLIRLVIDCIDVSFLYLFLSLSSFFYKIIIICRVFQNWQICYLINPVDDLQLIFFF